MSLATCQDAINQTQRLLQPINRDVIVTANGAYSANATTLNFTDISANSINSKMLIPGVVISVDLELMLITSNASVNSGSIGVSPGYLGSTPADHSSGALIYINRRFTDFEIQQQMNNVLDDLGSQGLYNLSQIQVTFNPVQQAYDLTDVNSGEPISNYIEGIGIRWNTPLPDRKLRTIARTKWEVIPFGSTTAESYFPSGYSLVLNDTAWPGLPILFIFKQGFTHLSGYTDSLTSVAKLPPTAVDLLPLGAMLRMVPTWEIQRNQYTAQPDSRLAPEVPPGAVAASANGVQADYLNRLNAEKQRLKRLERQFRSRY